MAEAAGNDRLALRAVSAVVLGTLAVLLAIVGGWVLALALLGVALAMAWEWAGLVGVRPAWPLMLAVGAIGLAAAALSTGWAIAAAVVIVVGLWAVTRAVMTDGKGLWVFSGVVYIALPLISVLWLRGAPPSSAWLVLWLFAVIWGTDIGAYVVGRSVGGPRLAPTWSPRKTWAGAAGGLAGALGMSAVLIDVGMDRHPWLLLFAAAMVSVLGQVGDLVESVVKRRFDRKDSGNLIPGHGGILDRLDSMVFGAPGLAVLVALVGREAWFWRLSGE